MGGVPDVQNPQMVQYGYHGGSAKRLPPHLVRYMEPTESEFDVQVEYDMDEQDQAWLDALNAERQKEQLDAVGCEAFEVVIDRLEKEWFQLVKNIPSKFAIGTGVDEDEFPEDTICSICDDSECENLNAIVFCDGCNLAVHQDCYGIPYIPEGQWLCRKCTVSPDRPVSCVLCPVEGGAFKQTTRGTWAHLLCAMWIPETGFGNTVFMEPIDGVKDIPKARWRLRCYLCNARQGACIQCEHRSCFTAFHVMCARRVGLLGRTQRHRDDADHEQALAAYCHHHLPRSEKDALRMRIHAQDPEAGDTASEVSTGDLVRARTASHAGMPHESVASKSARAYNKLYSAGPLPIPNYLVHRVMEYIARIGMRRKAQTVGLIVRYWSLKRQEMRGAPLLKRLHIEPWTVGQFVDERTSALRLAKLQYLYRLREDLEKVRLLAELVRKREKEKKRQAALFQTYVVDGAMLYRRTLFTDALAKLMDEDKNHWFLYPVSKDDAPDYYDVIPEPMDWTTIQEKITSMAYASVDDLEADVRRVCANAMHYNTPHSPIFRLAHKIDRMCTGVCAALRTAWASDDACGFEPSDAVVETLTAPPPADSRECIGAPSADASTVDAFLQQWYPLDPPTPPTPPSLKRVKTSPVEEPPAQPQEVQGLDSKDTFTLFHVGWLLPPGARRNNRAGPVRAAPKDTKRSIPPAPAPAAPVRRSRRH